jgi:hypothetical protein
MTQRHFVDVWNPAYASNSMEAHLTLLLDWAGRWNAHETDVEPYVWWGKVRSANRQQDLPHLAQILQIAAELEQDGTRECHLYLTDYRSLYVGHVERIVRDDVRLQDATHVPEYYTTRSLQCDFWYRLLDLLRLVADDTTVVVTRLQALKNLGYAGKPVSLYGGMVNLPLIVESPDETSYFAEDTREAVTGERLWAEVDAEAVGVGKMERELREDLLGDDAWLALDPAARTFIASAERIYRDQRSDPAFDYAPIVANFSKALEVTCNAILRRVAPRLPREVRNVVMDGQRLDLATARPLTIGQLSHALGSRSALHRALRQRLAHGDWFVDTFPKILTEVAAVRNPAVHRSRIDRETATRLRNTLVGVGCQGTFVELARVEAR